MNFINNIIGEELMINNQVQRLAHLEQTFSETVKSQSP